MALEVSRHLCGDVKLIKLQLPRSTNSGSSSDTACMEGPLVPLTSCSGGALARRRPLRTCPEAPGAHPRNTHLCDLLTSGIARPVPPLRRCSLATMPLALKAGSVGTLCTRAELTGLIALMEEDLPFESRGRVRLRCRQNPFWGRGQHTPAHKRTPCAGAQRYAAASGARHRALGRGPRTIAFLQALNTELPRLWVLQNQADEDRANLEVDLLLEDQIAEEEELEAPLHAELLHTCVPYEATEAEQEAVKVYKLDCIPPVLEAQFSAYRDWRLEPLNYQ